MNIPRKLHRGFFALGLVAPSGYGRSADGVDATDALRDLSHRWAV